MVPTLPKKDNPEKKVALFLTIAIIFLAAGIFAGYELAPRPASVNFSYSLPTTADFTVGGHAIDAQTISIKDNVITLSNSSGVIATITPKGAQDISLSVSHNAGLTIYTISSSGDITMKADGTSVTFHKLRVDLDFNGANFAGFQYTTG
ncbi:MAG: hypothetical protein JRN15_13690 [Nitrososphaerota archaeon]|nr:hypothetical protein [Nitrososphaerota archaeon]